MAAADRFEKHVNTACILAILFGLIIRFYPDGRGLWMDELYSVVTAYRYESFMDMFWGRIVREIHPPLYQIFLYCWVGLFGDSDYVVRFPSMLAGAAVILIAYFHGKELLGRSQALLLAALFSVSWSAIYYSHEARSYSLLLLLSTVLMLKSLKLMATGSSIHPRQMLEMFTLGILLCHLHYFGALLWFSNLIALTIFLKLSRRKLVLLGFASMLAFVPWMILNAGYIELEGGAWISQRTRSMLLSGYLEGMLAGPYAGVMLVAAVLYGLFFQFNRLLAVARREHFLYSIAVVFLAGFFALLINRLFMPILTSRNMIILLPFLYMIISTLFAGEVRDEGRFGSWLFRIQPKYFGACIVIGIMANASWNFAVYEKEDWRESSISVARSGNLDRVFYIGPSAFYWHYLRKTGVSIDKMTQALDEKDQLKITAPQGGSVSALWCCNRNECDPYYQRARETLAEAKFAIVDEKLFSGINSCAYTVFR